MILVVYIRYPVILEKKTRFHEIYCVAERSFYEFLNNLPMASPFTPFSNFEGGLVALSSGSTFAASTSIGGSLVSKGYQYLAGMSYCSPYCLAVSYVISVGIGSASARGVNGALRSHFLEKYKAKWLLENQGKYYVENGVLRKIPIIPVPADNPVLPEGLAFICPVISGNSVLPPFLRVVIVYTISRILLFVSRKMGRKVGSYFAKDPLEGELVETRGLPSNFNTTLYGLKIYHSLIGGN
jgi:hypothetical protein